MKITEIYAGFFERATWEYRFTFLPQRCLISNKLIWLTYGYKGTFHMSFLLLREPITVTHWLTKGEYIIARLTGLIP